MRDKDKAAHKLEGLTLADGWRVIQKLPGGGSGTGGVYSAYYEVKKEDVSGFLKAFDYSGQDKATDSKSELIEDLVTAFNYERMILSLCTERGIKGVVRLLATGWHDVPEVEYPRVEYVIIEFGEGGDCRSMLESSNADLSWKLQSLHQVANALNHLHGAEIAHQDIKPSNIVNDQSGKSRISDLGSAYLNNYSGKVPSKLNRHHCGTYAYAPPELLYGHMGDFELRRRACDAYLFGSLISFYFTNVPMTALIQRNLDEKLSWTHAGNLGRFEEVRDHVAFAFSKAMNDLSLELNDRVPEMDLEHREELVRAVQYLSNPDPYQRGHPKNILSRGSNYSLTRVVSMLARLSKIYGWRA